MAAGILIVLPVCGLRPVLADRARTEKVPKPTNGTSFPRYRATGFELTHAGAFGDVVNNQLFKHLIRVASVTGRLPERDVMLLWLTHPTGIRVTELAFLEVADLLYPSGTIKPEVQLGATQCF